MLAVVGNNQQTIHLSMGCGNIKIPQLKMLVMGTVTQVLNQQSLQAALADKKLQALLYQELRIIAKAKLKNYRQNDLNTTALVHEAYLKLSPASDNKQWSNRRHFYATAALAMRHILVDLARQQLTLKKGQNQAEMTWRESALPFEQECQQMVALNEALEQLQAVDPRLVEVVNLRYFVGMTVAEAAKVLDISDRTLNREWLKAKALLMAWLDD